MTTKGKPGANPGDEDDETPGISGPKSYFRRKVRTRPSVVLTAIGHTVLADNLDRLGVSRSDFYETLLHKHAADLSIADVERISAEINQRTETALRAS